MEEVQVTGLDADGVSLISPLSPEFDSRVDTLSPPGMANVVKNAKPSSNTLWVPLPPCPPGPLEDELTFS